MTNFLDKLGPGCPECGEFAPLNKTFWKLGTPFACRKCETKLVVAKANMSSAIVTYALLYMSKGSFPGATLVQLTAFLIIGLGVEWLLTSPKRVQEVQ